MLNIDNFTEAEGPEEYEPSKALRAQKVFEEIKDEVIKLIRPTGRPKQFRELICVERYLKGQMYSERRYMAFHGVETYAPGEEIEQAYFNLRIEVIARYSAMFNSMVVINHDLLTEIMRTNKRTIFLPESAPYYKRKSIYKILQATETLLKEWKRHYKVAAKEAQLLAESIS